MLYGGHAASQSAAMNKPAELGRCTRVTSNAILLVACWANKGSAVHRCGTSLPTSSQKASQAKPRPPTNFSRAPGPALAAMLGSTSMPAAEPRYMPEVLRDTAFALSCGGIHCSSEQHMCLAWAPAHQQICQERPVHGNTRSRDTSRRSCKVEICTWDRTVWTEGIRKPCAIPTATLANMMAELLAAEPGVSMEAVDQSPNDTISMRRPPQRCAAHPPGTCIRLNRNPSSCHCFFWLLLPRPYYLIHLGSMLDKTASTMFAMQQMCSRKSDRAEFYILYGAWRRSA